MAPRNVAASRALWLPEAIVLGTAAIGSIVLFGATRLDVAVARLYFRPGLADPWPYAESTLWWIFYESAPWVTALLAIVGSALLVGGLSRRGARQLRLHGLFLLAAIALGPGLLVNAVFKDHGGRPRPRHLVEFGGHSSYVAPLQWSDQHGKSFPCGHCSIGYLYAAGWWSWRRRHPWRAVVSLIFGLSLGTLLGLGRIAAGAHFLSDVVWSALIAYGVAHVLYFHVLRIPAREDRGVGVFAALERDPRRRALAIGAAVVLGLGVIGGGLLASPDYRDLRGSADLRRHAERPRVVEIVAGTVDVDIRLVADGDAVVTHGSIHGFGLPTNEITSAWSYVRRPVPTLRWDVRENGFYTDVDGIARIEVPVRGLVRVVVRVRDGDVYVVDACGCALPAIDVRTGRGDVVVP